MQKCFETIKAFYKCRGYYDYITALESRAEAKLHLAKLAGREPGQMYWIPTVTEIWAPVASLIMLYGTVSSCSVGATGMLLGFSSLVQGQVSHRGEGWRLPFSCRS